MEHWSGRPGSGERVRGRTVKSATAFGGGLGVLVGWGDMLGGGDGFALVGVGIY